MLGRNRRWIVGEAKQRGSFAQRKQQAQAKRAALFVDRMPAPNHPVVVMSQHRPLDALHMLTALCASSMSHGVYLIRKPNASV
jgi:hypothetical protein